MAISADCSNETLYIAQKFVREVARSNHLRTTSTALYGDGLQAIQRLYSLSKPLSVLSGADVILCLGFDGKYTQSVVDVKLKQAKKLGAQMITFHSEEHSLSKAADEWLRPTPGAEVSLLEALVEGTRGSSAAPQVQRAAQLLSESKRAVILLGPSFLVHPDNLSLLKAVEQLIAQTNAELVMLPDTVNLAGAFRMGVVTPVTADGLEGLEVLHLVGETVPADLPAVPFILYQNIYPPARGLTTGLILPATAFTEEGGTFLDHSGTMRSIQRAVQAPGSSLPSWQILCRIAQKLGVAGFDYKNAEQIRAEFETMTIPNVDLVGSDIRAGRRDDHSYMGYPLGTWVAGFRILYPQQETGLSHGKNS
jgi:NADH dehydrogenase/NADH:ubiquinone oxidoreductase subunit G